MDIETISKMVALVVAIAGVGWRMLDFIYSNKSRLREEYKFARDFFEDLTSQRALHPFVIEKGYHAISGTTAIKGEEVAYILTLENSAQFLRDFVLSRKYLDYLNSAEYSQIVFARKYQNRWSRTWRKGIYFSGYVVFAFSALSPLVLATTLAFQSKQLFGFLAFTLPVFGWLAFDAIRSFARIYRGEKLVASQQKYMKKVVLSPPVRRRD
ncbi:hypothetical protein [Jeongeupia sp. USM3]|uniref:hypothetical protein n=1 Tax=Jeongeupia sp. USM3 TaxID=1906741 RepID=UPI0011AB7EB4|nr:hypothetical protein [Jeongeupia sp. USM3]